MLSVLKYSASEGFHNIVVNIFGVALVDALMPLLHAIPQLKINFFPKVNLFVVYQVHIPRVIIGISIFPSPEWIHGDIFRRYECTLFPS